MKYRLRILSDVPLKGYRPMPETTPWAENAKDIGHTWRIVGMQHLRSMDWGYSGDITPMTLKGLSVCTGPCLEGYVLYARIAR